MRKEVRSILNVVYSNMTVMIIGIILTFIVPNILSPRDYGYWALYSLYITYAGVIIIGFCDGFYLREAGEKYENINKKIFSGYFYSLVLYLLLFLIAWTIIVLMKKMDNPKRIVMLFIGVGMALTCLISFFTLLNQATTRFKVYSRGNIIEKCIIVIICIVGGMIKKLSFSFIILASILGKFITMIFYICNSREIISTKPSIDKKLLLLIFDNIKIGSVLTVSSLASMLMSGFGRFLIERELGVIDLGHYSLIFSVMALFTQIIIAISIVLYPTMKKTRENKKKEIFCLLNECISNFSGIVLLLYYPARFFFSILFRKYELAMPCFIYLFPIIICQSKITIIYNNAYKIYGKEKKMLKNTILVFIVCVIVTTSLFFIKGTIYVVALATSISYIFWEIYSAFFFYKMGILNIKGITVEIIQCIIYICINYVFGYNMISFMGVMIMVIIGITIKRKENLYLLKKLKSNIKE